MLYTATMCECVYVCNALIQPINTLRKQFFLLLRPTILQFTSKSKSLKYTFNISGMKHARGTH